MMMRCKSRDLLFLLAALAATMTVALGACGDESDCNDEIDCPEEDSRTSSSPDDENNDKDPVRDASTNDEDAGEDEDAGSDGRSADGSVDDGLPGDGGARQGTLSDGGTSEAPTEAGVGPDAGMTTTRGGADAGPCELGATCEPDDCRVINTVTIDGLEPDLVEFATGDSLPPGCYRLSYVQGAYKTGTGGESGTKYAVGTYLYSDEERVGERIAEGAYPSVEIAEMTWEDTEVIFQHCGGAIAVGNADRPNQFKDNGQGNPNPIWRLETCGD